MLADRPEFKDRVDAGQRLARALAGHVIDRPLVLALPRGGVPVAYEVARALEAELDIVLVRKLGAPGHEELGIGAVIDGAHPQVVLNEEIVRQVSPSADFLQGETWRQLQEIERRRKIYLGDRPPVNVEGRNVILVDDGIATGGTVRAALQGLAKSQPANIILAVPVAPAETLRDLAKYVDEIVCLSEPDPFYAVGAH